MDHLFLSYFERIKLKRNITTPRSRIEKIKTQKARFKGLAYSGGNFLGLLYI